ncbi:MAG: hypothetical protein V3W41_11020 [Planctomycetota bacterium]
MLSRTEETMAALGNTPDEADIELFGRGLSEILDMLGVVRGTRSHAAIHKMMVDDLTWYFENLQPGDLDA